MKVRLRQLLSEASRWKELSTQLSPDSINKIKKANGQILSCSEVK